MSSATSPALPAFSYAQAARGLPTGSSKKSVEQSATSSETGSRGRQPSSNEGSKVDTAVKASVAKPEVSSPPSATKDLENRHVPAIGDKDVSEKDDVQPPKRSASSVEESKSPQSPTVAPSQGSETLVQLPKEDDFSLAPNGATDAWERQSEASTSVEKGTQTVEKTKSQNGDDDWEKVSAPSVSQERDLKAAPVPTVNFWTQRKIAQDARREQTTQRPSNTTATNAKPRPTSSGNSDVVKGKAADKAAAPTDKEHAVKRKQPEAVKQGNETRRDTGQVARPMPQSTEKLPPPPPVGDATAWPTPETATTDDRRKSYSLEMNDKGESKATVAKPHGKKWTQVPFVPTAIFNTPLPPIASKRGGRGGANRGGGMGRGGHAAQNSIGGEKNEATKSMGPPPLPRQGDQDRGRKQDGARDGRSTSVPTQGRRSASAAGVQTEPRKASGNQLSMRPTRAEPTQFPSVGVSAEDATSRQTQGSHPSSKPANLASKNLVEMSDPFVANDNSHAHPSIDPATRAIPADWYTSKHGSVNGSSAADPSNDKGRNREVSTRDKVESWRDRDSQSEVNNRREPRAERGRGAYRGRGDRAQYGTSYTAPLPQQPFPPAKSQSFHENRQRQSSQPYPLIQPATGPRQNIRAHSIPVNSPHQQMNGMNGMPGMSQPLSPVHPSEMAMAMYPYPSTMHPAILGQFYNPGLEMYSIISMVSTQVEYYFSIDNLCKDVYLRSNMDSQGFVLLHVIAKFKRIDKLTKDIDILRYVCGQSKILEVRQGEDGEDRVRRREGWEQWVLPRMEDRAPAARNNGPSGQPYQPRRPPYNGYSSHSEAAFLGAGQMRSPSWIGGFGDPMASQMPTGAPLDHEMLEDPATVTSPGAGSDTDHPGHHLQDITSKASRNTNFSSLAPPADGQNPIHGLNGHVVPSSAADTADQENVFPNEQIPSLWVYPRKDDDDTMSSAPMFASNSTRTLSQGSQDGRIIAGEVQNDFASSPFVSGLRGGAGSPEQIQRLRSQDMISFGESTPQNGIFFLKDGVSQSDFDREASDPWHYQTVHAKAVEQREQGLQGPDNQEMDTLYHFWPTFLIERFNSDMYMDFKTFAIDDFTHGYTNGNANLAKFYEKLLSENKPLAGGAAIDIVEAVARENGEARPVFQKLRSQWRNGAFNLKSRKRIDTLLGTSLRMELEK